MVIVRISGGLGNQMFQYAAGCALAQRLQTELDLDLSLYAVDKKRKYMLECWQIPQKSSNSAQNQLKFINNPFLFKIFWRIHKEIGSLGGWVYQEPYFYYDAGFTDLKAPVKLYGYFFSPLYFAGYENVVLQRFQLAQRLSDKSSAYVAQINKTGVPVSLHVRRGDYVTEGHTQAFHGVLPLDYYKKAVQLLLSVHKDAHFFLFSDDEEFLHQQFGFCPKKTVVKTNVERPWEDMRLMSLCHHHIVANSSFSWWGAWLNPRTDKLVIAPRAWFSKQRLREANLVDFFPKDWILI